MFPCREKYCLRMNTVIGTFLVVIILRKLSQLGLMAYVCGEVETEGDCWEFELSQGCKLNEVL